MNIEWTLDAKSDIKRIFKFYKDNFSEELAKKVINQVFKKVKNLELGTKLGQKEVLLLNFDENHRCLIVKYTKIIYKEVNEVIYITHFFDTRQNPKKNSKTKF